MEVEKENTEIVFVNSLSFRKRYLSYFSARNIFWLTTSYSLIIIASILFWKVHVYKIIIILPIFVFIYMYVLIPVLHAKQYITQISISKNIVSITYLDKNKQKTLDTNKENMYYSLDNLNPQKINLIKFQLKNDIIIKQYQLGAWNTELIKTVIKKLKESGIKRPIGENI